MGCGAVVLTTVAFFTSHTDTFSSDAVTRSLPERS
jgi:hypothetical protein